MVVTCYSTPSTARSQFQTRSSIWALSKNSYTIRSRLRAVLVTWVIRSASRRRVTARSRLSATSHSVEDISSICKWSQLSIRNSISISFTDRLYIGPRSSSRSNNSETGSVSSQRVRVSTSSVSSTLLTMRETMTRSKCWMIYEPSTLETPSTHRRARLVPCIFSVIINDDSLACRSLNIYDYREMGWHHASESHAKCEYAMLTTINGRLTPTTL